MFRAILFSAIALLCHSAAAQMPAGMSGAPQFYAVMAAVADSSTGAPVTLASVELKQVAGGKVVDGGLTDSTGRIFIRIAQPGDYYLEVTAVGYTAKKTAPFTLSDSSRMVRLGRILLSVPSVGVVDIKVEGPLIENKVDRLVYNASQDISSKGGSATDLLRKVPMVEVDLDGNVSIRGSQNIRVLINGRPSGMMSGSVRDALRTIPADQIERVEVITNPSVKYDAEGTAGIINIVMKESKAKGITGGLHAGAGNRSGNLGARVSVVNGKLTYNVRMGGHFWRNVGAGFTDRVNRLDTQWLQLKQESNNRLIGAGPMAGFGVDYQIDKLQSLSFNATVRGNISDTRNDWETSTGLEGAPLAFIYGRDAHTTAVTLGYDATLDYRRNFKKKKDRELGISAMFNGNTQTTDYTASQVNAARIDNYREKSENIGLNREYTLQVDFTEPIHKKLLWESGIKGILRHVTSDYHFDSFNFSNQEYRTITARNNNFYYDQTVSGGYSQFTWQLDQKTSFRAGGRYEFTTFGGGRQDSGIAFTGKPYGNFIPFLNINRIVGKAGFARLSYTRRLQRPSLFYLNPYTNYSDPRNITTGSPYLSAEVAENIEFTGGKYGKGGGGSVTAYARFINNAIETIRQVDSFGVYRTTYGNVGENMTTGADVNFNLKGKLYMINFNGGLGFVSIRSNQQTGVTAGLKTTGMTYSAGLWGNYKFHKFWTVEAFARFNAPAFSLQGRATSWYFHTIGIKRRFKSDKGGIGLGVDNPFTPHVYYNTFQQGNDFKFTDKREVNMLGLRINFDYRFGKVEFEQPQKQRKGIKNDDLKPGDGGGGTQGGN